MPVSRYILELSTNNHSARTVSEYGKTIRRWQHTGLSAVEYLAGMKVKPSSRTKEGIIIRRYLNWAVAQGLEPENPLASIRFHAPQAPQVRPFSQAEIAALMAVCMTPIEQGVVTCLLFLGLRASELASVGLDDVDGETMAIKGKGGKTRRLAVTGLVEALRVVAEAHLTYQRLYRMFRAVGRRAGIPHAHPHRCRHTFAHNFLAAGGDSGDLRVLLGHSSWVMTARYTAYYENERALSAHRKFLAQSANGKAAD